MLAVTAFDYSYYIAHKLSKLKWSRDETVFYFVLNGDLKGKHAYFNYDIMDNRTRKFNLETL